MEKRPTKIREEEIPPYSWTKLCLAKGSTLQNPLVAAILWNPALAYARVFLIRVADALTWPESVVYLVLLTKFLKSPWLLSLVFVVTDSGSDDCRER
jgi:hypothetical protein